MTLSKLRDLLLPTAWAHGHTDIKVDHLTDRLMLIKRDGSEIFLISKLEYENGSWKELIMSRLNGVKKKI